MDEIVSFYSRHILLKRVFLLKSAKTPLDHDINHDINHEACPGKRTFLFPSLILSMKLLKSNECSLENMPQSILFVVFFDIHSLLLSTNPSLVIQVKEGQRICERICERIGHSIQDDPAVKTKEDERRMHDVYKGSFHDSFFILRIQEKGKKSHSILMLQRTKTASDTLLVSFMSFMSFKDTLSVKQTSFWTLFSLNHSSL